MNWPLIPKKKIVWMCMIFHVGIKGWHPIPIWMYNSSEIACFIEFGQYKVVYIYGKWLCVYSNVYIFFTHNNIKII
jgi:hypothetical protein